eukprot:CAMPEP_0195290892 /NCGR_PEP_ID=MMETSP0707-20130614/6574_1 /TAXON_ID=33640 /ORGANISM="Asterionellopsis glacialis, Strain CCMP134" /LENGTH=308 /DNA_ID=CAMNT_0040351073 /DNA_START=42 /DNA_END=968 /DNA_ORIENTATION=+
MMHITRYSVATKRLILGASRNVLGTATKSTSTASSSSSWRCFSSTQLKDSYDHILVEKKMEDGVGLITLNRPKALNALCDDLSYDVIHAATALDQDDDVSCMVLTGSTKAFAAGADIAEMSSLTYDQTVRQNKFAQWDTFSQKIQKPIIAAVNGFALGGGCELAMMCDMIIAGDKARFGQPEINLGVMGGLGGTQRLTRAIGKSKSMYMNLTGEMITAQEAFDWGLVAKVVPADTLIEEALKIGKTIHSKGRISTILIKEAVNAANELPLTEGLKYERQLFRSLFATEDQKEGMAAFLEKRSPEFKNK